LDFLSMYVWQKIYRWYQSTAQAVRYFPRFTLIAVTPAAIFFVTGVNNAGSKFTPGVYLELRISLLIFEKN
jgi:hypothetical protein